MDNIKDLILDRLNNGNRNSLNRFKFFPGFLIYSTGSINDGILRNNISVDISSDRPDPRTLHSTCFLSRMDLGNDIKPLLTKMGDIVRSRTYEAFFPLIAVAVFYFILAGILIRIVDRIEVFAIPGQRKEGQEK